MSINQPLKFDLGALDKYALSMSVDDIYRQELKRSMVVEEAYIIEYFSKYLGIPVETLSSKKVKITDLKGVSLRRVCYNRKGVQITEHTCNGELIVKVCDFTVICGAWKNND